MFAIAAALWFAAGVQAANLTKHQIIHTEPKWHVVDPDAPPPPLPPGWTAMTVVRR